MTTLTKEQILAYSGIPATRTVHVAAWGGDVIVRGMTMREFEVNQATLGDKAGLAAASLVARCVVDSATNGRRVFSDTDIPAIAELPLAAIGEVTTAISELSGLTEDSKKAIEGNSDDVPASESGSDSAETSSTAL